MSIQQQTQYLKKFKGGEFTKEDVCEFLKIVLNDNALGLNKIPEINFYLASEKNKGIYTQNNDKININSLQIDKFVEGEISITQLLNTLGHELRHHIQAELNIEHQQLNDESKSDLIRAYRDINDTQHQKKEKAPRGFKLILSTLSKLPAFITDEEDFEKQYQELKEQLGKEFENFPSVQAFINRPENWKAMLNSLDFSCYYLRSYEDDARTAGVEFVNIVTNQIKEYLKENNDNSLDNEILNIQSETDEIKKENDKNKEYYEDLYVKFKSIFGGTDQEISSLKKLYGDEYEYFKKMMNDISMETLIELSKAKTVFENQIKENDTNEMDFSRFRDSEKSKQFYVSAVYNSLLEAYIDKYLETYENLPELLAVTFKNTYDRYKLKYSKTKNEKDKDAIQVVSSKILDRIITSYLPEEEKQKLVNNVVKDILKNYKKHKFTENDSFLTYFYINGYVDNTTMKNLVTKLVEDGREEEAYRLLDFNRARKDEKHAESQINQKIDVIERKCKIINNRFKVAISKLEKLLQEDPINSKEVEKYKTLAYNVYHQAFFYKVDVEDELGKNLINSLITDMDRDFDYYEAMTNSFDKESNYNALENVIKPEGELGQQVINKTEEIMTRFNKKLEEYSTGNQVCYEIKEEAKDIIEELYKLVEFQEDEKIRQYCYNHIDYCNKKLFYFHTKYNNKYLNEIKEW